MTDAEKEVRAAWVHVAHCDGSYRGYPKGAVLMQPVNGEWYDAKDWQAALEFTNQRKAQIREVEEEIDRLEQAEYQGFSGEWMTRILSREQDILAELKRGMR